MRNFKQTILCLVGLLVCANYTAAQDSRMLPAQTGAAAIEPKPAYPLIGCESAEFKAKPRVYLTKVYADANGQIDMLVCIEPTNDNMHMASAGVIDFISHSNKLRFMYHGRPVVRVDGQPAKISDRSLTSSGSRPNDFIQEVCSMYISYENFQKIVKGERVELSVGVMSFGLAPEHLQVLRDLAKTFDRNR